LASRADMETTRKPSIPTVSQTPARAKAMTVISPVHLAQTLARVATGSAVRACSQMAPCMVSMPRLTTPASRAKGLRSPKKPPV
jgi:hypothetical protein